MNELKVFSYESNEVRTVMIDGQPWWIAKDVCDVLGVDNVSQALDRIDDDERNTIILNEGIGNPEKAVINESGLYSLVLSSRKPEAKAFKKWITSEVLPTIRKTGEFTTRRKQIRDKSKVVRNHFTETLKLHGCDKWYHYKNITNAMKKRLGITDKPKDSFDMRELSKTMLAEDLAIYRMIDHESRNFDQCFVESKEAADQIVGLIEDTKQKRIGA